MSRVVVSYSELATFRQCPLKHQLAYIQRWSQPTPPGSARDRGHAWHSMLETHYRAIQRHQQKHGRRVLASEQTNLGREIWDEVLAGLTDESGRLDEQAQLLEWMYQGHLEAYGLDTDWLILDVEQKDEVPLPGATGKPSSRYYLKTRIDLVVQDRFNRIWVVDHKSGRYLPQEREHQIDDQFGLYTWAKRQQGVDVFGAIYSAARTDRTKGDQDGTKPLELSARFNRFQMFRTDAELQALAEDAGRAARASRSPSVNPPYSSPSPDTCKYRCDYLDAHMDMRAGVGTTEQILSGYGFEQDFTRH